MSYADEYTNNFYIVFQPMADPKLVYGDHAAQNWISKNFEVWKVQRLDRAYPATEMPSEPKGGGA